MAYTFPRMYLYRSINIESLRVFSGCAGIVNVLECC
jgi:hypothetical protein